MRFSVRTLFLMIFDQIELFLNPFGFDRLLPSDADPYRWPWIKIAQWIKKSTTFVVASKIIAADSGDSVVKDN